MYIYIFIYTHKNIIYIYISAVLPKKGNDILKILPEEHVFFFYVTYREKVTSMYLIDSWLIYFALGPKKSVHVQPVGLPGP